MDKHNEATDIALQIMAARGWAARMHAAEVAEHLGFAEHDIPVLVSSRLLKPLGKPAANSTKWFSTVEIIHHSQDILWLDKATKRIGEYWKQKQARRIPKDERPDGKSNLNPALAKVVIQ
jgi:hypothetical protein